MMINIRQRAEKEHISLPALYEAATNFDSFEDMASELISEVDSCLSKYRTQPPSVLIDKCFGGSANRFAMSMYDIVIEAWLMSFPLHHFCILESVCVCREAVN